MCHQHSSFLQVWLTYGLGFNTLLCCRDEDGAIIRPLPRCKRMLSDATNLPHIVQLLLTFEPIIVEKVSKLLSSIMMVRLS